MIISTKEFDKILAHTKIQEAVEKVEKQIDDKLSKFAVLPEKDKKQILASNDNYIVVMSEAKRTDYLPYEKYEYLPTDFCFEIAFSNAPAVRKQVVEDYTKAGWNISWDKELNVEFGYVLKIRR
ncbi:MAG: hypothetical protein N4R51_08985 [Lactobacillus crispatus]|nr:hypothetical protein [Lactobacillus crispatus]